MDNKTYSVTPLGAILVDKLSQTCQTCERTFICARGKLARETGAGKHPDWKKLYQEMLEMEDYGMECEYTKVRDIITEEYQKFLREQEHAPSYLAGWGRK